MNTHQNYTLASRPQTSRVLRGWAVLSRGTFSGANFLADIALIAAMSCLTGIAYHLVVYGNRGSIASFVQVGLLAASIFAISNLFRREYPLPNFFSFKPHARRTIQLWNVTLVCLLMLGFLAQISVDYSRGWILLFYVSTLAALIAQRYFIVRIAAPARTAGLLSAQRIFLIGTGANVGAFVNRYEPWTLGIDIVGCRFLTPVVATSPVEERRAILDRDLAAAVLSVRDLEPDAVFVLAPWSATETTDRCAETFLRLPVEIHLGPEQVLYKFEEAKRSTLGPIAAADTQAADAPRNHAKTTIRPGVRRGGADPGDAIARPRRRTRQARQPRTGLLRAASLRLQPTAISHHQVSQHACAR
jgi:hypothetical protein